MLTVKRAVDRETMAATIVAIAWNAGAKTDRRNCEREIIIDIEAARRLCLSVSFDGSRRDESHVLSWHIKSPSQARLAPEFSGCINEYHRHKATDCVDDFDELCFLLVRSLRMAADGMAFLPD